MSATPRITILDTSTHYNAEAEREESFRLGGVEFRSAIPLLDSGKVDAKALVGSLRNIAVEGFELRGDVYFARGEEGDRFRDLLTDGHITPDQLEPVLSEIEVRPRSKYVEIVRSKLMLVRFRAVALFRSSGSRRMHPW